MFIVNRKDDQIADLESQLQSLKEIADSMKKSLEQQATEKAKLVNMNSSLQSSLKQKEEQFQVPPFQSSSILLFLVGERTSLSLWQLYHILQALRRRGIEANQEV